MVPCSMIPRIKVSADVTSVSVCAQISYWGNKSSQGNLLMLLLTRYPFHIFEAVQLIEKQRDRGIFVSEKVIKLGNVDFVWVEMLLSLLLVSERSLNISHAGINMSIILAVCNTDSKLLFFFFTRIHPFHPHCRKCVSSVQTMFTIL